MITYDEDGNAVVDEDGFYDILLGWVPRTTYDLIPDPVEDVVEWAGDRVEDLQDDTTDLANRAVDEMPDALGRFGSQAAATAVLSTAAAAASVWLGFKIWKAL